MVIIANLCSLIIMLSSINALATQNTSDDDLFGDWESDAPSTQSPWQISGFTELAHGAFTQNNVVSNSLSLSEARAHTELEYTSDAISWFASGDILHDEVVNDTQFNARELYLSFSPTSKLDLKIGKQVITWGTGDYLFLNDLFAKDWQSFFSGRSDEYLKASSNSLRLTAYIDSISIDLAYTPRFTPDNYINGERFSFFSPLANNGVGEQVAPNEFSVINHRSPQWSMRIASTVNGVEYAAYGYRGRWTTPVGSYSSGDLTGQLYFPQLRTYGASARLPLANGIFNAEFSVYNSIEDRKGNNPNIANDQSKLLVGYEQELVKNLTGSVQFYLEHTRQYHQYINNALFENTTGEQNRQVTTLRLTHRAMQQKLSTSLFVFYSPTDNDAYLKPSIQYRHNDNWQYSIGANLFYGDKDHTFFGQHQQNSNAWLRVTYNY